MRRKTAEKGRPPVEKCLDECDAVSHTVQGAKRPCIMIVESDAVLGSKLSKGFEKIGADVVLAHTAAEASPLFCDMAFIGCSLDALLVAYSLHASTGESILPEFLREFPKAAIAMTIDAEDLAVSYWAKVRGIRILQKPIRPRELFDWVETMRFT